MHILEDLVLIHDLDAMPVGLLVDVVANAGKVRVHHHRGRGRVSDGAGAGLAIDGQVLVGHV